MSEELRQILRTIADKAAKSSMPDDLRQRLHQISRDFFADKPPGTSIEESDLNAYRQRLRDAVRNYKEAP